MTMLQGNKPEVYWRPSAERESGPAPARAAKSVTLEKRSETRETLRVSVGELLATKRDRARDEAHDAQIEDVQESVNRVERALDGLRALPAAVQGLVSLVQGLAGEVAKVRAALAEAAPNAASTRALPVAPCLPPPPTRAASLRPAEAAVLAFVQDHPGLTNAEIADLLEMSPATVVTSTRRLRDVGLVVTRYPQQRVPAPGPVAREIHPAEAGIPPRLTLDARIVDALARRPNQTATDLANALGVTLGDIAARLSQARMKRRLVADVLRGPTRYALAKGAA